MKLVYIPQLEDLALSISNRYQFVNAKIVDGTVAVSDRAVTRVEIPTSDPVTLVLPPAAKGMARDFLVRLVVTADEAPEITFVGAGGESISFEEGNDESFLCVVGTNVYAFTETEPGVFTVNRKIISIIQMVSLDLQGGRMDEPDKLELKLGAPYGALPQPMRDGYRFLGWFTQREGGERITAETTVKSGVSSLYAQWEVYVDVFKPALGAGPEFGVFYTSGDDGWYLDDNGVPRSGVIGDSQTSSLTTTLDARSPGNFGFHWRASTEAYCDRLVLYIDGSLYDEISGESEFDGWYWLDAGRHSIEWRYEKDGSSSEGEDAVWLSSVYWNEEV